MDIIRNDYKLKTKIIGKYKFLLTNSALLYNTFHTINIKIEIKIW